MRYLKGTKLYSILTGKCPVCHKQSMYTVENPCVFGTTLKMEERCSACSTKYKIEPSFFFGAMYVSYPVGLFFAGITFALSYVVFNLDLRTTYAIIVLVMIALLPVILRISRNIWINFFMQYENQK